MINSRARERDDRPGRSAERRLTLGDPAATERLAVQLAPLLRAGDVLAVEGPLGVGKTAFARALIGALGGAEEVPSPTFTLVQTYEFEAVTLFHFDLYRLGRPSDAYELGIEDAFAEGVSLIEWPERLGALLPAERLDVVLRFGAAPTVRDVRLVGHGGWAARLEAAELAA